MQDRLDGRIREFNFLVSWRLGVLVSKKLNHEIAKFEEFIILKNISPRTIKTYGQH